MSSDTKPSSRDMEAVFVIWILMIGIQQKSRNQQSRISTEWGKCTIKTDSIFFNVWLLR
jgi:hypothetical protein